jgi:hypothetical protein
MANAVVRGSGAMKYQETLKLLPAVRLTTQLVFSAAKLQALLAS